jgi:hypothetical protein
MKATDARGWLLEATCEPAATLEALGGWYQPSWCPWIRLEVRTTGPRVLGVWHCLECREGVETWCASLLGEFALLPEEQTFLVRQPRMQGVRALRFAYHHGWRRYELQLESGVPARVTRIPLVRVADERGRAGSVPGRG